uniref:PB1-like domain-containing protein n=1 Tax=Chenopodium quinoa TaxID=63459 RepID=A0A803MM43_CHEQI
MMDGGVGSVTLKYWYEDYAKKCGVSVIEGIYYLVPGLTLSDGLRRVYSDAEVLELSKLVIKFRCIEVYVLERVEHPVLNPLDTPGKQKQTQPLDKDGANNPTTQSQVGSTTAGPSAGTPSNPQLSQDHHSATAQPTQLGRGGRMIRGSRGSRGGKSATGGRGSNAGNAGGRGSTRRGGRTGRGGGYKRESHLMGMADLSL